MPFNVPASVADIDVPPRPSRLLSDEQELLDRLVLLARTVYRLPFCCLGLVPYHLFPFSGSPGQTLPYHTADGRCEHLQTIMDILSERKDNLKKAETIVGVKLAGHLCGFWGLSDGHSGTSGNSNPFYHTFRSYYLRYWCYHESIHHFGPGSPVHILGEDPEIVNAVVRIERCGRSDLPVLITGETGTGKEVWAKALHLRSERKDSLFLPLNCAHLLDDSLASSSLFGHMRGSFTGAAHHRDGFLKTASGGTLFLDEIESLSVHMQGVLLRTLETGEIHTVGEDRPSRVDVRILAATNEDLKSMVSKGTFRKDLYFRLKGQVINLPPLRYRIPNDIEQLAYYCVHSLNARRKTRKRIHQDVLPVLHEYRWPGNVRELLNTVTAAYYESEQRELIREEHFPSDIRQPMAQSLYHDPQEHAKCLLQELTQEGRDFWEVVHQPYLHRDLNRTQVRQLIRIGLEQVNTYKELATLFNLPAEQYQKFMDFLRHHRLH